MAKDSVYICGDCGGRHSRWQGQCNHCGKWNTLKEDNNVAEKSRHTQKALKALKSLPPAKLLGDIQIREDIRFSTGSAELDRVLGGGLVAGSVILIGGSPGAGKSTLLMQAMADLSRNYRVCYVSGEESESQIVLHARRLGVSQCPIRVLAANDLGKILATMERDKPDLMVIDSIQVMHSAEQSGTAGGVAQVRECAMRLMEYAKSAGCAVLIIGHVTKEGSLAGPRVLEHLVDASLLLESTEDTRYRTLRALKNRFGRVNEVGIFAMTETGLKGVRNPSAIFLSRSDTPIAGSVTGIVREGSRPMLVEVQSLADSQVTAYPRQIVIGMDANRAGLLMAVLNCHCGISPKNNNIYISLVGGLRVEETATDLPLLLAVVSILKNKVPPPKFAAFGEVGLNGEIRPSAYGQERIEAAVRHGFHNLLVPEANAPAKSFDARIRTSSHIGHAIETMFEMAAAETQSRKKSPQGKAPGKI